MQTFLPYKSFKKSVEVLDNRRLGKQRVEAYQILKALAGQTKGWVNHPAVKMWRGHEQALSLYMNHCIIEWTNRGFKNTMKLAEGIGSVDNPVWLGDEKFHASHRSNLLRKFPEHYSQFGWEEKDNLPYIWPIQ